MLRKYTMLLLKIALFLGICAAGYSAHYIFKKNDTPLEQAAEKIIEEYTGYEIDFTPQIDVMINSMGELPKIDPDDIEGE